MYFAGTALHTGKLRSCIHDVKTEWVRGEGVRLVQTELNRHPYGDCIALCLQLHTHNRKAGSHR